MIEISVNGQRRRLNLEPGAPPAVANAVAALTKQHARTSSLSKTQFGAV